MDGFRCIQKMEGCVPDSQVGEGEVMTEVDFPRTRGGDDHFGHTNARSSAARNSNDWMPKIPPTIPVGT